MEKSNCHNIESTHQIERPSKKDSKKIFSFPQINNKQSDENEKKYLSPETNGSPISYNPKIVLFSKKMPASMSTKKIKNDNKNEQNFNIKPNPNLNISHCKSVLKQKRKVKRSSSIPAFIPLSEIDLSPSLKPNDNVDNYEIEDLLSVNDAKVRKKIAYSPNIKERSPIKFTPLKIPLGKIVQASENCLSVVKLKKLNSCKKFKFYEIAGLSPQTKNLMSPCTYRYKEFCIPLESLEETKLNIENSDLAFKDKKYQRFIINDNTKILFDKLNYLKVILENGVVVILNRGNIHTYLETYNQMKGSI